MRFTWLFALTMACGGKDVTIDEDSESGPSGDVIEDNSCDADDECTPWEICEDRACVDGDRDNSFSEATNFTQSEDGVGG